MIFSNNPLNFLFVLGDLSNCFNSFNHFHLDECEQLNSAYLQILSKKVKHVWADVKLSQPSEQPFDQQTR